MKSILKVISEARKLEILRLEKRVAAAVQARLDAYLLARHDMLGKREEQILLLTISGQSMTEIAKTLFLSVKTVNTHRSRIIEKLDLVRSGDLQMYAVKVWQEHNQELAELAESTELAKLNKDKEGIENAEPN